MNDLIAFLTARLDEDTEVIQHARDISDAARRGAYAMAMAAGDSAYVAHFDRDRALREVEAKRRMLGETWGGPDHQDMWENHVRLLAAVHADHPDYRKEWRP